jgi:Tfp pilus assembly protein PilO
MSPLAVTLRPRERRLLLITIVIVGCAALVMWIVQPLWDHMSELRRRVDSSSDKLQVLSRLMARAPEVDEEYAALTPYLTVMGDGPLRRQLLNELERLAGQAELQLTLKPRPVKVEAGIARLEVEVEVEGSQRQLLRFVDALLDLERLVAVERLRLASIPAKVDRLRLNVLVQQFVLR